MLLVDLEATTSGDSPSVGEPLITDDNREIIEIGLVVIDLENDQEDPVARFSTVVRPVLNPNLTPFCVNYTGINHVEVDAGPDYLEASAALADFVSQLDTLTGGWCWGSWGVSDLKLLERNATRSGIVNPLPADRYFDLKATFQAMRGERGGTGQTDTLKRLGVKPLATAHRAPGDALNLAALYRVMRRYAIAQAAAAEHLGLEGAQAWMREDNEELGGHRPAIILHSDESLAEVLEVIEGLAVAEPAMKSTLCRS
jgi:inhibitor of KinA sporulation pathway (predicted exonuclease)